MTVHSDHASIYNGPSFHIGSEFDVLHCNTCILWDCDVAIKMNHHNNNNNDKFDSTTTTSATNTTVSTANITVTS